MSGTIYDSPTWLDFIVKEVKAPLVPAMEAEDGIGVWRTLGLLGKLPTPTKENMHMPNTAVLVELRDEFFAVPEHLVLYGWMLPAINGFIFLYDYDSYYRWRIDFVAERWIGKAWVSTIGIMPRAGKMKLMLLMATLKFRVSPKTEDCTGNLHTLAELRDGFFGYENNNMRDAAFKFIWKTLLVAYKESAYFQYPFNWMLDRWQTKTWAARDPGRPRNFWREWDKIKQGVN